MSEAGTAFGPDCSTVPDRETNLSLRIRRTSSFMEGRTIAGVGLKDLIIVDDDDATLIVRKGHTEQVKQVIEALAAAGNSAGIEHSFEYRPWDVREPFDSAVCKVKRLTGLWAASIAAISQQAI